jgi:hypothetical protein
MSDAQSRGPRFHGCQTARAVTDGEVVVSAFADLAKRVSLQALGAAVSRSLLRAIRDPTRCNRANPWLLVAIADLCDRCAAECSALSDRARRAAGVTAGVTSTAPRNEVADVAGGYAHHAHTRDDAA